MLPKNLGGLGVLDLNFFGRALRLRWLWYAWTEPDRPWVGSIPPCDEVDKQLFRASTIVQLGDGNTASFWNCSWMNRMAPRDFAPGLYKLAWRKNRTVKEDIINQQWTRGLWRMDSIELMAQFVVLWDAVHQIQLTNMSDQIFWKWTANGVYTAKSAYLAQLKGTYCSFDADAIWHAHAEGKHRFFAWLLVQEKILTADKLAARNWPSFTNCVLCDQEFETATHLCLHCPFAQHVWHLVSTWTAGVIQVPQEQDEGIEEWWKSSLAHLSQAQKRSVAAILTYTTWNIWKEKNRRVFEQKCLQPHQVVLLIKKEINLRRVVCGTPVVH